MTARPQPAAPQWLTSSRLLRLGESIRFDLSLPPGADPGCLVVYPRYLERAEPGSAFAAGGTLDWVAALPAEHLPLSFAQGRASLTYEPRQPGSYLAVWSVGGETLYRYFAAIEEDWIVLRFSTFLGLEPEPTLHAIGIPLDYRLPIERYRADDPLCQRLLGYYRRYGDALAPQLPDLPEADDAARRALYGEQLAAVRALLADPADGRCVRVEMRHPLDPGYIRTLADLGVNNLFGLQEANARPWLGMPEFPYFASPLDARKVNQDEGGAIVAHQWDFCGGWHFVGPVSWHYGMAEGDWGTALRCIRQGLAEARNLAELSGHPAFLVPLYDGVTPPGTYRGAAYPVPLFHEDPPDEALYLAFVERYQRYLAFDAPKAHRVAFARSIDIADYYRRHYRVTPQTVFVSRTDHLLYDIQWLCAFNNRSVLVTRERIPWETRISSVMAERRALPYWKDPLSSEYLVVENQHRQMRFERACPNPIWWFDYTHPSEELVPGGSAITHVETPDVDVVPSRWTYDGHRWSIRLRMRTRATFEDYAIALWGLPVPFSHDRSRIDTNAKEFVLAKNLEGECHLVLLFDLNPDAEITVALRAP